MYKSYILSKKGLKLNTGTNTVQKIQKSHFWTLLKYLGKKSFQQVFNKYFLHVRVGKAKFGTFLVNMKHFLLLGTSKILPCASSL